jgi:plastocyanin
VTALFVFTVDTLGKVDTANTPTDTADVTIDVTGFQWQWTFEYPEQGIKLTGTGREGPTMALPIDEKVRIRLHATDVIHSFYVPQFLYKRDAIPGRINQFDVVIKQAGTFSGQCAEFCGLAHADMHFSVQAMTRAEFDAWVIQQQQQPSPDPSALPSGAPTVNVTSISTADGFEPNELSVAADTPWAVNLTNADPAIPHNFSIYGANPDGSDWIGQPNADGGGSAVYQPPPLPAGDYEFYCSLHTNMVGTLRVGQ